MERIVLRVTDGAGEGTVFIQVAGDAIDFESFKPAYFFSPDEMRNLANDLTVGVFQQRRMAVETGHRRLRLFSRLLAEKLQILRKRPEKTFRGQRLRVKGAAPFFELFNVAGATLSRRRMAATKIRYWCRGIRLTIFRAVRRCRLPRDDFPERAEQHQKP